MKLCTACLREFIGPRTDCPYCGFNNSSHGGPRSARSLAQMKQERLDREEVEWELAEMTEEFVAWLHWSEAAEREHEERTLA